MVLIVRCFKCGKQDVRLIVGGRSIIHARCHSCGANLLDEVMEFEAEIEAQTQAADDPNTTAEHKAVPTSPEGLSSPDSATSPAPADENP